MPLWLTLWVQTQSLARFSLALCSRSHTTLVCFRRTKFLCLMSILGGNHPTAPGRRGEGTLGGGSLAPLARNGPMRCDPTKPPPQIFADLFARNQKRNERTDIGATAALSRHNATLRVTKVRIPNH